MWKRGYFLSAILCVLGVLCIISEPANAYEVSQDDFDVIYTNSNHPYCRWNYSLVGASSTKIWGSYSTNAAPSLNSTNAEALNAVGCGTANANNMYLNVRTGDVMTLYVRQLQIFNENNSDIIEYQEAGEITGFSVQGTGDDELDVVDFEQIGQLTNRGRRVTYWKFTGIVQMNTTNPNWGIKWYRNPSYQYEMIVDVMGMQLYRPRERLDYTDQLDDILNAIDGISTSTGVKEGMEEAMEDEKEQIQDASDDAEASADSAGDEAESETESLTEAVGDIINAIRTAQPTNCKITINTGHVNLGEIDLCNAPENIRTLISNLLTIPITLAVLHIGYSIIMLYLNTIRKEQE